MSMRNKLLNGKKMSSEERRYATSLLNEEQIDFLDEQKVFKTKSQVDELKNKYSNKINEILERRTK